MAPRALLSILFALILVACGRGESTVDPGPELTDEATTTSTTVAPDPDDEEDVDDDQDGDVVTDDSVSTTAAPDPDATTDAEGTTATTIVVNPDSENAEAYLELGASGLVLSLDEQDCADAAVTEAIDTGVARLPALVDGVKSCASPAAVDAFASGLLSAGGSDLPANEAACVASTLRGDDAYLPFWSALFDEEPFDFLAADTEVQNLYLDLFSGCVSVGRALSNQIAGELSVPSIDCIDRLYADREFVRVTIEADLSGDPEEIARINQQIRTCLTGDERDRLGVG
jgi:hypothetical protein